MKKRIVSLLACGVLTAGAIAGLAGCGNSGAVNLTLGGSAAQQETLAVMVEEFKKANPDTNYNIKIVEIEEDMAYSTISKDPSAAADVYCYSNDQLIPLLRVGALARLGGENLAAIKANNSEDSVKSASIDWGTDNEKVYGYPYASDNGYFMYYDKSVLSEEDVTSLETIISVCKEAGKNVQWALDVPWYTAGWFFTFGCTYNVEYDYNQNYAETSIDLTGFDGEAGIKASKAMAKLVEGKVLAGTGKGIQDSTILDGFTQRKTAVAVSGTWNAKRIKEILGDDYGVCELPTVTVDGETKHLYSFKGYKLIGVNPHSGDNIAQAHKLAAFLSSESMQQVRFEKHLVGPTNTVVANSDAVKNDPTIAALIRQNAYAVEQTAVPSNFWEPVKNHGLNILDNLTNASSYADDLAYMVSQMNPNNL